jgi:hypothetical protein
MIDSFVIAVATKVFITHFNLYLFLQVPEYVVFDLQQATTNDGSGSHHGVTVVYRLDAD